MHSVNYFNTIAKSWDALRQSYFDESLKELILNDYDLKNAIVADLGTGTGFLSIALAQKSALVFGIDASHSMLKELHRHSKRLKFNNLHPIIGSFEAIPLFDDAIDYVFSNMALHHVQEPQHAIREMYRILKPGGSIHISDVSAHDGEWAREEMFDIWLGFEAKDLEQWFLDVGFENIQVRASGLTCQGVSSTGIQTKTDILFATATKPKHIETFIRRSFYEVRNDFNPWWY